MIVTARSDHERIWVTRIDEDDRVRAFPVADYGEHLESAARDFAARHFETHALDVRILPKMASGRDTYEVTPTPPPGPPEGMSGKHYAEVAAVLHTALATGERWRDQDTRELVDYTIAKVAQGLADVFTAAADGQGFDRRKFLKAVRGS